MDWETKNKQDIKPIFFFINKLKPILNIHPELIKKILPTNQKNIHPEYQIIK